MRLLPLAWRQLRRDLAAGDIRILFAALVLAVVAVTAVGFVTDRAERALAVEANRMLGGDAVVRADGPIDPAIAAAARREGLRSAGSVELPTMIRVGRGDAARLKLGELRALDAGFPLRGRFRIADARGERTVAGGPPAGALWLTRAGADALGARAGDAVGVGEREYRLDAIVVDEPDGAAQAFAFAPKAFIAAADLASTGLIQPGSRASYTFVVAGDMPAVERFVAAARAKLPRGHRLDTAADARPEIRSALDRGGRFLGLAALVSVVLAAVAVAMAARRHSERHLSGAAVMRCLGASQRTLAAIHIGELAILGVVASALGAAIAFVLQWAVGAWLTSMLKIDIPPATVWPALRGLGVGMVVLLSFGAPPVLALRRVPALRVLRRDLDATEPSAWLVALAGFSGLGALLWWQAGSAVLGLSMLIGIGLTLAALGSIAWLLIAFVRRARGRLRGPLRYGLANVSRRAGTSVAQIAALGLGLMVLLLLTFVRTDLLDRWRNSISADAPNRFIVNVQPDQIDGVRAFVARQGIAAPALFPMIRGRLVAYNGRAVAGEDFAAQGERAKRLAEREFNLSSSSMLTPDNRITAGRLWPKGGPASPELSVEEDFAKTLGWKIGDRVAFDIAGQRFDARITSFRRVEWESFKPNFFVIASPGALDAYAASYITAVKVPASRPRFTAQLVEAFPNLTVIDVDAILAQVRDIGDRVALVVQVVFWFSLAAGVLVLLAAVSASQDERLREGAVMRALGGNRRQLRLAQASEFAAIGLLSGTVAAIAASILAGVVATQVFKLPWQTNWTMACTGALIGIAAAMLAGLFATRRVLDAPPSLTLRELEG